MPNLKIGKSTPENVALEKESQSAFTKAMKTIKKLVKSGEIQVEDSPAAIGDKGKVKNTTCGAVYLSHIPHGFYEDQMKAFFSQFGKVTRLKVARSGKTGRSKGFAFIEFRHKEVAQIVAETMNNFLMFTRLLKAEYIPPEKITETLFGGRRFRPHNCPGVEARNKNRKLSNKILEPEAAMKKQKKARIRLNKMQARLDQLGIDYKIQLGGAAAIKKDETASEENSAPEPVSKKPKTDTAEIPTSGKKKKSRKSITGSVVEASPKKGKLEKSSPIFKTTPKTSTRRLLSSKLLVSPKKGSADKTSHKKLIGDTGGNEAAVEKKAKTKSKAALAKNRGVVKGKKGAEKKLKETPPKKLVLKSKERVVGKKKSEATKQKSKAGANVVQANSPKRQVNVEGPTDKPVKRLRKR